MPARKRRAIQRAVEDEVDEQRDAPGNDEQRDLEKLYNVLEDVSGPQLASITSTFFLRNNSGCTHICASASSMITVGV